MLQTGIANGLLKLHLLISSTSGSFHFFFCFPMKLCEAVGMDLPVWTSLFSNSSHIETIFPQKSFPYPFRNLSRLFKNKKYTVLHELILSIQPVTFSSFPFSLTGQFRKGSPVRVFRWWWGSLSARFFSSCETFTPRNQIVAVKILWKNCKTS